MSYTHRLTDLLDADPATDRSVYIDGECIVRVYQFTGGPTQGQYGWFGM